jgi:uncharacterized membrane protein YozB (DUF420 family)
MSKELYYIRFLQFSVLALTFIFIFSIIQAKKGNISLHKKINLGVLLVTAIAVVGLLVTIFGFGFDYKSMQTVESLLNLGPDSMGMRLNIHRCFSTPLFCSLIWTTYTGVKDMPAKHKSSIKFTSFFWLGTLITALLFF